MLVEASLPDFVRKKFITRSLTIAPNVKQSKIVTAWSHFVDGPLSSKSVISAIMKEVVSLLNSTLGNVNHSSFLFFYFLTVFFSNYYVYCFIFCFRLKSMNRNSDNKKISKHKDSYSFKMR